MLVCNVSLRPPRSAIAADIAEFGAALDVLGSDSGQVVFATLVDDPASVGEIVDAYLGEIMLEAASANTVLDGSVPATYTAAVGETMTATDTPDATIGAIAWTPASLATLKLWLKGDSNTGADGSGITTWADASGLGNNATGSTSKPTVKAADLNGLNTVQFAGTAQWFTLPNILTGLTAGSVIFVVKLDNDPTGGNVDAGITDFGGDPAQLNHYGYSGDGNIYDSFGSTTRRTIGNPSNSLAAWHMTSMHAASNDMRVYINATSFYTTASNTVGWKTPVPVIGHTGSLVSGGNNVNGRLAELIFVNEVLSTSDRQKLEGYLAYKWGIQSVLPGGHPYKTTPP